MQFYPKVRRNNLYYTGLANCLAIVSVIRNGNQKAKVP